MEKKYILDALIETIKERRSSSVDSSYVAQLCAQGLNKILEKVGEEGVELLLASKDASVDSKCHNTHVVHEMADLLFHCLVLFQYMDIDFNEVFLELERRSKLSGLEEKASRD